MTSLSTGGNRERVRHRIWSGAAIYERDRTGDLVNGAVPTNFKGICVELSGTKAPIFGASNTQVNFQVPSVSASSASVQVLTNCGASNQIASAGVNAHDRRGGAGVLLFRGKCQRP